MKLFKKYINYSSEEPSDNFGIQILNIGHFVYPSYTEYPDQDHPEEYYFNPKKGRQLKEYQLIYIANGYGYFEAFGLPARRIGPGTIVLLFPEVWHRYYPELNTGWEEYWVGFKGDYAKYLLEKKCFSPENPIVDLGIVPEFLETFANIKKTLETDNVLLKKMASFHLIHLLGITYSAVLNKNKGLTQKEITIHEMRNEIHNLWSQNIDFESLCNKFNVSYSWFRKAFKETINTSPSQYLLILRLRNATRLIRETDLLISQIAFQCGFNSEYYFSRIFKEKMKMNPTDFRKS